MSRETEDLLRTALAAAVPICIHDLQRRGGANEDDFARARAFSWKLAEHGDDLQYGGKPGIAAKLFQGVAENIAVLAFCPGGITFLGMHFEAKETKNQCRTTATTASH
jgi:hypothetical protein